MDEAQVDSHDPALVSPAEAASSDKTHVEISGKIIWQAIGAILATLLLLWMVVQARGLVSMVFISFFFSLALEPGVRYLTNRYEWRRGSATGVIFAGAAVFVVFMVFMLIPAIADLARAIGERGAEWVNNISDFAEDTFGVEIASLQDAQEIASDADASIGDFATGAFGTVLDVASSGISLIFNLATVAMFTFYFTADAPKVQNAVLRLFSAEAQERIGWTWDQAIVQTGGYFYSRMILFGINGLGFFFTMVLVGMPVSLAIPLALFGGFVSVFIPAIGTYLGGAVPILVTLGIQGLTAALIVLAYVLIYQQLENYWLSPKISSETMTLNGGVAFGAALAGGAIAGPMGAFTALPIAALISSFISNYIASNEVVYHSPEPEPKPDRKSRRRKKKAEPADAGGDAT